MKPLYFLHSCLVLLVAPVWTLLISVLALIWMGIFRRPSEEAHSLVRFWGKVLCVISGVRVEIKGIENLVGGRPYIFAANHQSQFDIITLQGYLDFSFRWLAKKELFKVPIWGTAMKMAGYIPVDRSRGRQALKSLDQAAKRIADGTSVVIFPEGTRSADGNLQPFKAGAMVLAIKAGVDLVPVAISGTYAVLPKGRLLLHPGRVLIRIGKPISTEGFQPKQKLELALQLQQEVASLLDQEASSAGKAS
jgi:1-acyl-sn-glycerol-3-phosphate acyltransferase